MKFKVYKEVRKTIDPETGKLVIEEPLIWIVDASTNKKIALLCIDCGQYATLLAAAPELLEHLEESVKLHGIEAQPFNIFDDGVKLLMKAKGEL